VTLTRAPQNPILTRRDIPDVMPALRDVSAVFNPGAIHYRGAYRLMLRVQSRGRESFLLLAESDDGVAFRVRPSVVTFDGLHQVRQTVYHVYDPRLTRIDGTCIVMFAADMDDGCRLGVARTDTFEQFEFLGFGPDPDIRNGVLFPERIGGKYLRLDRPNRVVLAGGPRSGDEIRLSESTDLVGWTPVRTVMQGRPHRWDERIGSGPPPVKTRLGWLHVYHGVATHFGSSNIYQAGVVLLDLDDPSHVVARCRNNILEPREPYELVGQVPNVVFPSGMVVERYDAKGFAEPESPVFIYYGAADTCIGLATSTIGELLEACHA